MNKKLILAACATIVAAAAVCGTKAAKSFMAADELFDENVEALTRRESGSNCTGPKSANILLDVYCRCTNDRPCADNMGC